MIEIWEILTIMGIATNLIVLGADCSSLKLREDIENDPIYQKLIAWEVIYYVMIWIWDVHMKGYKHAIVKSYVQALMFYFVLFCFSLIWFCFKGEEW